MKSLRLALCSVVFAVLTSPVFAQQQSGSTPAGPPDGYGYNHMWYGPGWGWGGGWHPGFFLGPLFMLLVLIVLVLIIVRLARSVMWGGHGFHHGFGGCPMCGHRRRGAALDILAERLARGEIDKAEYEEKRKLLGG